MTILTPRRFAAGFLSAAILSVPVAIIGTTPAHAAETWPAQTRVTVSKTVKVKHSTPKWNKHDKRVMREANETCEGISDDVTHEFCVVGAFHLGDQGRKASGRVLTVDDYAVTDSGEIVLVQANGKVA